MPRKKSVIAVLITPKQLTGLLRENRKIAKATAELTGELREKIAYAVDKHGLHKKAFAVLKQMDKMEPEAALEMWAHLQAYLDMSGVTERMESAPQFDMDDEPAGKPAKVVKMLRKVRAEEEEADLAAAE